MTPRALTARQGGRLAAVLLALGAAVLAGATIGATPALAHAVLESSSPYDGERLAVAPTEVRFVFDEPVALVENSTAVLADTGQRVDQSPTSVGGTTVVIALAAPLADGAYTASYRVVSADGHPVSGTIRFGVNTDPAIPPVAPHAQAPTSLDVAHDASQGAVYLGLVLLVGVAGATRLVWPEAAGTRRMRGLAVGGWSALLLGTLTRLATGGPLATGSGWIGVLQLSGFDTSLREVGGLSALARLALLGLLLPWVTRSGVLGPVGRFILPVLSLPLLVTVALDGHAAAGSDAILAVLAATIHLAAMTFWLGGLIVLSTCVLPPASRIATRLGRWSILAYCAVALLVLTGEYLGWRQVQPLDALVTTSYGQVLLLKLGLVAAGLALAVLSRRIIAGPHPFRRRLRTSVVVEAVILAVVVAATTVLVATAPARSTYGPVTDLSAPLHGGTALVRVEPTHTGIQTFTVRALGSDTQQLEASVVTATLSSSQVAGTKVPFTRYPDGTWHGTAIVPTSGLWTATLTITLATGAYTTEVSYRTW